MARSHIPGGGIKCGDPNNPAGPGRKANGDPCGNTVVPGTFRCYNHGGASPAAKQKAELALALLRMPAIEVLYNAVETLNKVIEQFNDDTCAACGYPKGDVEEKEALIKACVGAAKSCASILDRTGFGPRSTLEVKQSDGDFDIRSLTDDERARMIGLLAEIREIKEAVRTRVHGQPAQVM